MNETVFIQLCEIILAIAAMAGIFIVLKASWYDLRSARIDKQLQAVLTKTTTRHQLPILVLIYTQNDLDSLKSCLASVAASQYQNFKIIVADNSSIDGTKKYLSYRQQACPTPPLVTHHTQTTTDRHTILRAALKNDTSSEIVVLMNATDYITPNLLNETAARFTANDTLQILRLRAVPADDLSISSLLVYFRSLGKNMMLKSFARSAPLLRSNKNTVLAMRRSVFENMTMVRKMNIDYASTLTYSQSPKALSASTIQQQLPTSSQWTHLFRLIGTIAVLSIGIIIVTYFLYTAMTLQSNILLTLSWSIVCLWLLAATWSDNVFTLDKKIALTFAVPSMYFIFYAQMTYTVIESIWKLVKSIRLPNVSLSIIHEAIQLELYSTHY